MGVGGETSDVLILLPGCPRQGSGMGGPKMMNKCPVLPLGRTMSDDRRQSEAESSSDEDIRKTDSKMAERAKNNRNTLLGKVVVQVSNDTSDVISMFSSLKLTGKSADVPPATLKLPQTSNRTLSSFAVPLPPVAARESDEESSDSDDDNVYCDPVPLRGPMMGDRYSHCRSNPYSKPPSPPESSSDSSRSPPRGTSPQRSDDSMSPPQQIPQPRHVTSRHLSGSGGICSIYPTETQAEKLPSSASPPSAGGLANKKYQHLTGGGLMPSPTAPNPPADRQRVYSGGAPMISISPSPTVSSPWTEFRSVPVSSPKSVYSYGSPATDDTYVMSPFAYSPDPRTDPEAGISGSPENSGADTLSVLNLEEQDLNERPQQMRSGCQASASCPDLESLLEAYLKDEENLEFEENLGAGSEQATGGAGLLPPQVPYSRLAPPALQPLTMAREMVTTTSPPVIYAMSPSAVVLAPVSPQLQKEFLVNMQIQKLRKILPRPPSAVEGTSKSSAPLLCTTFCPPRAIPNSIPVPIRRASLGSVPQTPSSCKSRLKLMLDQKKLTDCLVKVDTKVVDICRANPDGDTNLHISVASKNLELTYAIVEKLVFNRSTLDIKNKKGQTPLFVAVAENNAILTEYLLECGADPSPTCKDGSTPLHAVIIKGPRFLDVGRILCHARNIGFNHRNSSGLTPLHLAVRSHSEERDMIPFITLLLEKGAELDFTDMCNEKTALHMAVEKGVMELVTAICASCRNIGSAINIECHFGTALHFAAQLNNLSESIQTNIIETLLHYGGSRSVRSKALKKFPKDLVAKERPRVKELLRFSRK